MATSRLANRAAVLLAFALVGGSAAAGLALGACGDGVLDPGEQCDHGPANGQDDCCSPTCTLVDSDYDGTCDALDPCPSGQGTYVKESRLKIAHLRTPAGDDTLRFIGVVDLPNMPAIDPSESGVRLRMAAVPGSGAATAVLDASLPGGARWKGRLGRWTYRDPRGDVAGIRRVDVKLGAPIVPTTHLTRVAFAVTSARGTYIVTPDMVTSAMVQGIPQGNALQVVVTMDAQVSTTGQCGEVWYTTLRQTNCTFTARDDRVTCTGPPPVGPCHISDPDDLMICDSLNAAHAEDRYFAAHGTYFTGPCTGLPGFVPSPGVICSASATGSGSAFTVNTVHPLAIHVGGCVWISNPAPGAPNIVCA